MLVTVADLIDTLESELIVCHKYENTIPLILENTKLCNTPRHFWLDKIICEHLYELVITIIVLLRHAVYTVSLSLLSVHHYFVYSFCITEL